MIVRMARRIGWVLALLLSLTACGKTESGTLDDRISGDLGQSSTKIHAAATRKTSDASEDDWKKPFYFEITATDDAGNTYTHSQRLPLVEIINPESL